MSENLPILYTFRRCPYAMRARMALAYAGINCIVREVDLKNKPEALLKASAKGTVPVLQFSNQPVLEESLDIIKWALEQNDPNGWNKLSPDERQLANNLIEKNDTEFAKVNHRYKYYERYPERSQDDYRAECEKFLSHLEWQLKQNGFLVKDSVSYADIALFPFVRQFSLVDEKWYENSPYTALKKWVKHFNETSYFETAMQKFDVWDGEEKSEMFLNLK